MPIHERKFFPSNYNQTDYILDPSNGIFLVENIMKFEDRQEIEQYITGDIGANIVDNEILVSTSEDAYIPNEEELNMVVEILHRDFEMLGYPIP